MTSVGWRFRVLRELTGARAPKFVDIVDVAKLAERAGGNGFTDGEPSRNVDRLVADLVAQNSLVRLSRGFFANLLASPVPHPAEAVHLMRPGAVVSLHTVLGSAGVLNNPTPIVYAVFAPDGRTTGAKREFMPPKDGAQFGAYRLFALRAPFLEAGDPADNLAGGPYPKATPERALIDWLELARLSRMAKERGLFAAKDARGTKKEAPELLAFQDPPLDMDTDLLDMDRLDRLARGTGLLAPLEEWLETKREHDAEDANDGFSAFK